jgi:hypothetical protein
MIVIREAAIWPNPALQQFIFRGALGPTGRRRRARSSTDRSSSRRSRRSAGCDVGLPRMLYSSGQYGARLVDVLTRVAALPASLAEDLAQDLGWRKWIRSSSEVAAWRSLWTSRLIVAFVGPGGPEHNLAATNAARSVGSGPSTPSVTLLLRTMMRPGGYRSPIGRTRPRSRDRECRVPSPAHPGSRVRERKPSRLYRETRSK